MASLPSQCLLKIFENVSLSIYKTLHNCIFVNKQWSSLAISILWRNPLENISSENDVDDRIISIMKTYIACISQKSKDSLMKNNLQLSEEILRQASYDYPSHLQILNVQKFYDGITILIEKYFHKEDREKAFHQYQLLEHIFRMFMNKCRNIYRIDISDVPKLIKIIHFPLLPDSDKCLSNITEFYYKGRKHLDFIYILSQVCTQIKSFHIEQQFHNNEGLIKLFNVQKVPLESLSIDFKSNITLFIEDIIKEKNPDNIIKLKLSGDSKIFFLKFNNLKELEINLCYDNYFLRAIFPKLEKLILHGFSNISNFAFCDFLKNHNIKYLYLRESHIKYLRQFSEAIINSCPNLVEYEGYISANTRTNHLLVLFKNCPKLEKLRFFEEDTSCEINDILKCLSDYIPKKLNTLRFDPCWEFNDVSLDEFLNGCKKRLTNKLNLEISSSRRSQDINLVLDKYARENVLYEECINYY
ncbi:hypothetical protein C1646_666764 [Rhizophagus diaphanus]|nr:hypothetical protein C1646_666764 [Rhizophagus diaphanus] [Rhizophagus sp. MUCL 43196]